MRRRTFLSATAAALALPLVAGCSRDDGGGGDGGDGDSGGGGGGPYGKISVEDTDPAARRSGEGSVGQGGGASLGPEPEGE